MDYDDYILNTYLGIQGFHWGETSRTTEELYGMIYPRLLALAERAWHKGEWEDEENKEERTRLEEEHWADFSQRIGLRELDRLEDMDITYNLRPPGARYCVKDSDIISILGPFNIH